MIKVSKYVFNPFIENTYLLWDEVSLEAFIIDPGCSDEYEENQLSSFIQSNKLRITYLLNTHCHIDHILGCGFIKKNFNPLFLVPQQDLVLFNNAGVQAEMFGIKIRQIPYPDDFIQEETQLKIGNADVKFFHTPGHTPGEFCFYLEKEKILFSGDVLFRESVGRTDLWGGNHETLVHSIKKYLFSLPDETVVYPGHGEETTIGYEKNNNPFLK